MRHAAALLLYGVLAMLRCECPCCPSILAHPEVVVGIQVEQNDASLKLKRLPNAQDAAGGAQPNKGLLKGRTGIHGTAALNSYIVEYKNAI